MLACVLDDKLSSSGSKSRFLEIDVNSKFVVNLVADEHRLFKKARVQKALRSCHVDSDKWCQQLKVIHHIYPSRVHRAQQRCDSHDLDKAAGKRARKLSLGDKKTVKSASFRFSTSYGVDDLKPLYRNLPPAEVAAVRVVKLPSHAPVYLDVAHHPNDENCCSSLPTQKPDRTAFKNETPQQPASRYKNDDGAGLEVAKRTVAIAEQRQQKAARPLAVAKGVEGSCSSDTSYHKLISGRNNVAVTDRSFSSSGSVCSASKATVTKIVDIQRLISGKVRHDEHQQPQLQRHHEQGGRYRVIKKENAYAERDSWNGGAPGQPLQYKTQVVVKIDDSYSDAMDAIRSSRVHQHRVHRHDNIYAEIDEYDGTDVAPGYVIFPQTKSCFGNESYSYWRPPSSSTVNVS